MRLERHVGGLSMERKRNYLTGRGWTASADGWSSVHFPEALPLSKALHHQLTIDLTAGLAAYGWKVEGYSARGYARLADPTGDKPCSLPAALRRQARREKRKVGELTYSLF